MYTVAEKCIRECITETVSIGTYLRINHKVHSPIWRSKYFKDKIFTANPQHIEISKKLTLKIFRLYGILFMTSIIRPPHYSDRDNLPHVSVVPRSCEAHQMNTQAKMIGVGVVTLKI